jgi:putative hydrolase of the HAD superfamily
MSSTRTLLIDADDTLWENNIYFERVVAAFMLKLGERGVAEERGQEALWQAEQGNIKTAGYGSRAFCLSLHDAARALGAGDLEPWIAGQEQWIFHHPIELMPGVVETLPLLHAKNRLILVSKGRDEEQHGKIERSGLAQWFHHVEIVFEKSVDTYRSLLRKYDLAPPMTWMIGNSPRSDINPAKAAGLRTVFIPYHATWYHELEEISPEGETLMLQHFGELAAHFA